jgi:transcriptional regulator with XRE-family HTH domain
MISETGSEDQGKSALRLLRERADKTQAELGREVGVSDRNIRDWENGESLPRLDRAVALARALKISLKQLCVVLNVDVDGVPDDCNQVTEGPD